MYLLQKLHQTYENNKNCIGQLEERTFGKGNKSRQVAPLLPIFHTTQNSQITIILDSKGKLIEAKLTPENDKTTIIPATEKSSGRTSGLSPHPLCDKLQYTAGDYTQYVREGKSGKTSKSGYADYVALLSSWVEFDPTNPSLQAILTFVKQGNLIEQVSSKYPDILPVSDQGTIITKWEGDIKDTPGIFKLCAPATPADALIRWEVEIRGEAETRVWKSEKMHQSWIDFVVSRDSRQGLCYVTGKETSLAEQHPSKIRNAGDGAKIVSSNDQAGFTFRGRFCEASEVCGIGSEVTQKAHSALRWLISRQGWTNGSLAIVAWSAGYLDIPSPISSTNELIDEDDDDMNDMSEHTEKVIGEKLSLMINGYREKLNNIKGRNDILVLGLDSASPGRLSVVYFQELPTSFYLDNISHWHTKCLWRQQFSTDNTFFGAPTPKSIAETAYGNDLDEKLLRQTVRRLLPCIIEKKPLPRDLVDSCIRRTANKIAYEWWEWEKMLGITCALYRYQNIKKPEYSMSLDTTNTDRSYLYGRLLACAECAEKYDLILNGETRPTNAERFMQRFYRQPYSTWCHIEEKLSPYLQRAKKKKPTPVDEFEKEFDAITDMFLAGDFTNNDPLSGAFYLGYHCERSSLRKNTVIHPLDSKK